MQKKEVLSWQYTQVSFNDSMHNAIRELDAGDELNVRPGACPHSSAA